VDAQVAPAPKPLVATPVHREPKFSFDAQRGKDGFSAAYKPEGSILTITVPGGEYQFDMSLNGAPDPKVRVLLVKAILVMTQFVITRAESNLKLADGAKIERDISKVSINGNGTADKFFFTQSELTAEVILASLNRAFNAPGVAPASAPAIALAPPPAPSAPAALSALVAPPPTAVKLPPQASTPAPDPVIAIPKEAPTVAEPPAPAATPPPAAFRPSEFKFESGSIFRDIDNGWLRSVIVKGSTAVVYEIAPAKEVKPQPGVAPGWRMSNAYDTEELKAWFQQQVAAGQLEQLAQQASLEDLRVSAPPPAGVPLPEGVTVT
jgi:hypothetical protein